MNMLLILCFLFSFAAGYLGYKFSTQSIPLGIGFTCFLVVFSICSLLFAQANIKKKSNDPL